MKPVFRLTLALLTIMAGFALFQFASTDSGGTASVADLSNTTAGSEPPRGQAQPPEQPPSALVGQRGDAPPAESLPPALPPSLRGTTVPVGWAVTDRLGNLTPTPELRQLFEYFLSALGEESLPQLVARIEAALLELPEPARTQAQDILGAYLDYKLAVAELEQAYGSGAVMGAEEMQRRMAEIQGLRRTWFDAETVEAFFAADEAIDRFQIERRRIVADDSLTEAQRQAALRAAERALPDPLREARAQTRRFSDYEQMRQALADDPQALATWRQQTFGEEAAERLAQVEQEQQAWERRWQAYVRERDQLSAAGLAGPELESALERLRQSHFTESEQVRAEALDSIR